jgi:Protein of unknown function (DUF2889)
MSETENSKEERRLLCTRKKHVDVFLMPGGRQYGVEAEMNDGVHHMKIEMVVNEPSLKIKEISCDMLSVPDEICRSATHCLDSMVEKRITHGLTRGMSQTAHKGCTHLANLFHEACYNIALAQATNGKEALGQSFPGITEEQLYKIFLWFKPDLKNSCVRYEENAPFMKKIEVTEVPEGAEKLKAVAKNMRN